MEETSDVGMNITAVTRRAIGVSVGSDIVGPCVKVSTSSFTLQAPMGNWAIFLLPVLQLSHLVGDLFAEILDVLMKRVISSLSLYTTRENDIQPSIRLFISVL